MGQAQAPFLPIIVAIPESELMLSVCRLVGCRSTPNAACYPVPANSDLVLDFSPPPGFVTIIEKIEIEVDPSEIFDIYIQSDYATFPITRAMGRYVLNRRITIKKSFVMTIKNTSPDTEGEVKIVIDAAIAPAKNYEAYEKSLDSYVDFYIRLLQQLVRVGYFSLDRLG